MSNDTNSHQDEYTRRYYDNGKYEMPHHTARSDEYDDEVSLPIFTRADLEPEEVAELDAWQAEWERGMVSDEEFAVVMQPISTHVCARLGIATATIDETMPTLRLLRVYLRQKRNNAEE